MNMKNLIRDKNGNANVIILAIFTCILGFGMLTIGSYIYFSIAQSADAGQLVIDPETLAYGTVNFTGNNITTGNLVNFTDGTTTWRFEFNASVPSPSVCQTAGCTIVNVNWTNNALGSATNFTAAVNAHANVGALVTATRSGNVTTLTAVAGSGTDGNSYSVSDNGANIVSAWTAQGYDAVTGQASQDALNDYVVIVFPLFGLALLILGFSVILLTLRGSFGKSGSR